MREVFLVYRCPDPDCGLVGLLHDWEFTSRTTPPFEGSWVPCPRCGEPMTELRKAGESDLTNPVRLLRYKDGGAIFTLPMGSQTKNSGTTITLDSLRELPSSRPVKKSVRQLAYGLLCAEQVAEMLGLSVQTVRGLWQSGELGYIQFNKKQRLCNKDQVEEYLKAKTSQAAQLPCTSTVPKIVDRSEKNRNKASLSEVRKKLSSWDCSSDSKRDKDKR